MLQPEEGGGVEEDIQRPGRIVNHGLVPPERDDVALAAAFDGAEQIVEVGVIVEVLNFPVQRLVLERDVQPLLALHLPERRVADARIELVELHRVFEMEEITGRNLLLVALDDGIHGGELHALRRVVVPAFGDQLIERDLGG